MFRRTRSVIFQAVGGFIGRLLIRTRPDQRRVLLACHNSMMATYLSEVHDLFKDDPRIVVRASVKTPEEVEGDLKLCRALLDCKYLKTRISKLLPWDLVIMANHPGVFREIVTKSADKVLRIPHGIGSKLVNGVDYMYNESCFERSGKLIYSRFFESSFDRQEVAIARNPEFEGKIGVIGSIRLDKIEARRVANVKVSDKGLREVLVVSSWGRGNLFDHLLDSDFARTARDVGGEFRFRLRPHPNLLSSINPNSDAFKKKLGEWAQLDDVELSISGESLESDLSECDLMLGDDLSSVSLFGLALGLPMVLWKTGNPGVGEGTFLSRLSEVIPCLEGDGDLGLLLKEALDGSPPPERQKLADDLRSYPNQAERRAKEEIYQLLELPAP